jgi:predicted nucleotidyltransferase
MILDRLYKEGVIQPPKWLLNSCHYLTIMGSEAYGVSSGGSDIDVYGFCVPPRDIVFPWESGALLGFDKEIQNFDQWQQHHCDDKSSQKQYDFVIYNIVKYFRLCMENNPNMIDSLFVPERCIIHITPVGKIIRENRKLFLHKGCYHKLKSYSYSQLCKIKNKTNSSNPKRAADIEEHGMDLKFAYHVLRLLGECEQILIEHDLDIEKNREQLKSVRRGEWTFETLENYFIEKEKSLETIFANSALRPYPDEKKIKELLLQCLEMAYGSIDVSYKKDQNVSKLIQEMHALIQKYR